jgi:uncharacterized protein
MAELNDTLKVERDEIRNKPFSKAYWDGTRDKRLLLQFCPHAGIYQFFPRPVSIATGLTDLEWREVDGLGEIYSYSVMHVGPGPFRACEPYAVVIVRLDVGVDIVSNLVNCDREGLRIGLRVRPFWMPFDDGRHLLLFEPDTDRREVETQEPA